VVELGVHLPADEHFVPLMRTFFDGLGGVEGLEPASRAPL
jgi:hypothetical protein